MIYVIVGPTGVGKTKLSIALAKRYHAEIINADSMQVYRGLDIGTAKITEKEKEGIPHHLLDICDVEDSYTVFDYQRDCRAAIEQLQKQGKNIILVGGTGLYLKAALYDYRFLEDHSPVSSYEHFTNEELFANIKQYDPDCDIPLQNRKRLIRFWHKIEHHLITEKTGNQPLYSFWMIGLTTDRKTLYEKISERVDQMIQDGLVEEVRSFYQQKIHSKAIQTGIGYKELYAYFQGDCTLEEAIAKIKQNSRHYAKRQYTFFRNQFPHIHWYSINHSHFSETVEEIIKDIEKSN